MARVGTGKSNGGRSSMQAHALTAMSGGFNYNQDIGLKPSTK